MFKNKKITIGLFIVFLLLFAGTIIKRYFITPEIQLKEVHVQSLSKETFDLSKFKGKVVVLNFWATWCPPCVQEMPMFENVYQEMKNQNIEFVLASDENSEKINSFITKNQLSIPIYHLLTDMKNLGIYTIPITFIFDQKGNLVAKKMGAFDSAGELMLYIQPYVYK
ncbi:MAG: TlpA family protein disulfide reductase [Chitinophagales bacterium]|nr:TlpA family protein disulfide reductase [Chitinophagales bacterium]MCZ2393551.1 TlpA family protein disulfide reductase [Chitinophagales bacterium]